MIETYGTKILRGKRKSISKQELRFRKASNNFFRTVALQFFSDWLDVLETAWVEFL